MILRPTVIKMIFILFITLFKNKKEGRKGTALDSVAHNACVVLTTDQPGLSTFSIRDTTLSNVVPIPGFLKPEFQIPEHNANKQT